MKDYETNEKIPKDNNKITYDQLANFTCSSESTPKNKKIKNNPFLKPKNFKKLNKKRLFILILRIILFIFMALIIIIIVIFFLKKETDCEDGYFHPNNHNSLCYKCNILNCKQCSGSINMPICILCISNFQLNNGKCLNSNFTEEQSEINNSTNILSNSLNGDSIRNNSNSTILIPYSEILSNNIVSNLTNCGEECNICDKNENKCLKCNIGYYLPDNDATNSCKKCPNENITECQGIKVNSNFTNCSKNFVYQNGACILPTEECLEFNEIENKCIECSPFYNLINGKCEPSFLIKATYLSSYENQTIYLINRYAGFNLDYILAQTVINGIIYNINSTEYNFEDKGENTVYFSLNKNISYFKFENLFYLDKINSYYNYKYNLKLT